MLQKWQRRFFVLDHNSLRYYNQPTVSAFIYIYMCVCVCGCGWVGVDMLQIGLGSLL